METILKLRHSITYYANKRYKKKSLRLLGWDTNKGGLRNTDITFCLATVLRAEGQIEFDRSLDLKIRRVHFLFSCEFRGPSGDFFIVGRVDKRNRHATTPWYLGFFDGQPPSRDFSRVNMCEYLCLLLDSAQVEYRDPSTFFKECFDEWPLCTREPIRKYIELWLLLLSIIQRERLFTDSRAFLASASLCSSWTVFLYAKSVTDFACNDTWTINSSLMNTRLYDAGLNDASVGYFYTRDWRIYVTVKSFILNSLECCRW